MGFDLVKRSRRRLLVCGYSFHHHACTHRSSRAIWIRFGKKRGCDRRYFVMEIITARFVWNAWTGNAVENISWSGLLKHLCSNGSKERRESLRSLTQSEKRRREQSIRIQACYDSTGCRFDTSRRLLNTVRVVPLFCSIQGCILKTGL